MPAELINVADRLANIAAKIPEAIAVAAANGKDVAGELGFSLCTFGELDADATALARGLVDLGVRPGMRLVLLVPPSVEFVKLVFALLRSGATTVLVDPGMGRKHLVKCLAAAEPDGFVAVSKAQAVRTVLRRRFPKARLNVTVGRRWFWGGSTYRQLLKQGRTLSGWHAQGPPQGVVEVQSNVASNHAPRGLGRATLELPTTCADDPAAIIFTSGSTGPPKGVLYTHRMFETQVAEIQRAYDLQPGGVDLACFALFGLFNSAMGVTTVFPRMDFSRPASANPRLLLAAAHEWKVTQAFASPAVWDKLSRFCETNGARVPTLRKVFSCGAPVGAEVIARTLKHVCEPGAEMHTPYGATEALPVSTIEAREILGETAAMTSKGAGVCVGCKFPSIDWRVIGITDEPIADINDAGELSSGEIGELIVRGPQVSFSYLPVPSPRRGGLGRGGEAGTWRLPPSLALPSRGREQEEFEADGLAKIRDGQTIWHRMGDVGYFDAHDRFWYCGRKTHRVETASGPLYTECVEAIFNQHPEVMRSALVFLGPRPLQIPNVIVELHERFRSKYTPDKADHWEQHKRLSQELEQLAQSSPVTRTIRKFLIRHNFPVDIRHNAKIDRERLAIDSGLGIDPVGSTSDS